MDFQPEPGLLALGSRLKRLGDRLNSSVAQLYRERGLDFEPRWFPLFCLLRDRGPATVGEAAESLGLSHAAVSQIASGMSARGLVASIRDAHDERRRVLSLTPEGRRLGVRMQPVWEQLGRALQDVLGTDDPGLLAALERIEQALHESGLAERCAPAPPRESPLGSDAAT